MDRAVPDKTELPEPLDERSDAVDGDGAWQDGLPLPRRTLAIVTIGLAICMTVLDSAIANVALPVIARDFGARPAESIWIVNAYQLAIVVSLLPLAALGEIVGYRRVYQAGLAVFTLASLACALTHSLPALTAARTLQGFGAAGVMAVNGALVRFTYPRRLLGRGIGLNAMIISASAAIGPTAAAAILAVGPWPWLFAVNVPLGLAALAIAHRALPDNPLSGRRFDWISAGLNAFTFGLIITGVDVVTRTRAWILGALEVAGGLAVGALLVFRELGRPRPLVPLDLLGDRIFALSVITSIASFVAQMLAFISLPFHFENVLGFSQVQTGLLMTPWPVAVGIVAPIAGRLADRFSTAILCAAGLGVMAMGLGLLALTPGGAGPFDIGWRMAVCGAGFGLFQSPNSRMMLMSAPRDRAGAAGGMLSTARLTGQTTGAVLAAILLHLLGERSESVALAIAAAFAVVAGTVSLLRMGGHTPDADAVVAET